MPKTRWPYYVAAGGTALYLLRPALLPGRIVSVAKGELGNSYQTKYGAATNWCAVFAGWAAETASRSLGLGVPSWRYENGRPVAGAKRLVVRAAEAGTWIAKDGVLLGVPMPGDLVSFDRGVEGSWQGHVGIIVGWHGGMLDVISGNAGSPSQVRLTSGKLENQRLEAIARPPGADPFMRNLAITAGVSYLAYHYLLR